jgi:hypothetical protein
MAEEDESSTEEEDEGDADYVPVARRIQNDSESTEEEDEGDADYAPLATRIKHDIELLLVEYDQITETFKQRIRKLLNSFED